MCLVYQYSCSRLSIRSKKKEGFNGKKYYSGQNRASLYVYATTSSDHCSTGIGGSSVRGRTVSSSLSYYFILCFCRRRKIKTVSYTHLTLPTTAIV